MLDRSLFPQVKQGLAARARALCHELLPRGAIEGDEWCVGSLAGEPGRSLKVHLDGDRAGIWCDFAGGPDMRGDALDLVAAVLFAGNKKLAFRWALSWIGLDGADPRRLAQTRQALVAKPAANAVRRPAPDRARLALALFLAARAELRGTPADRYLKGRGIDLGELGRQPAALRFHPSLFHRETYDRARRSGPTYPCLVASIVDPAGATVALHRTYLECLPGGSVVKLGRVRDAKLTLGRYAGGMIRLWRGLRDDGRPGRPWRDLAPGEPLVLTEGIENGLSVALADPSMRVGVTVSIANMARVMLPPQIGTVTVFADPDPPGSSAAAQLERAIDHLAAQGKRVRIARVPGLDANDARRAWLAGAGDAGALDTDKSEG